MQTPKIPDLRTRIYGQRKSRAPRIHAHARPSRRGSFAVSFAPMASLAARSFRASLGLWILVAGCSSRAPTLPAPRPPAPPLAKTSVAPPPPAPARGLCDLAKDLDPLPAPSFPRTSTEVSREHLTATINVLADAALHGRGAGSVDNRRVARWIADQFAAYGLPPSPGANHCLAFDRNGIQDQNVVAHLHRHENADAPVVLVGAHYDAQGQQAADVFPGADDNASGVAALLEIARISALSKTGPGMVLVAFGAEERGLWGAKAYIKTPTVPLSRIKLMINLDMVGRPMLDGSPLRLLIPRANETIGYVIGNVDKEQTDGLLQRAAERDDRPIIGIPEAVLTRLGFASDSVPFSPHVPTIFLSTGDHADYHRPTDTPEKLDFEQLIRATRLTLAIVDELASRVTPK